MSYLSGPANIWSTGGLSNGYGTRANTRESSSSRDVPHLTALPQKEEVEGKSGSGSLVHGSFSLGSWSDRNPHVTKRDFAPGRSFSQTGQQDTAPLPKRNFTTAAISPTASGASQTNPFASRPPAISLNKHSSAQQLPVFSPSYGFSTSRGSEPPPTVYTKFDRLQQPSLRPVDSAIDTRKPSMWTTNRESLSPTDERRPRKSAPAQSEPVSRDASAPPSRHSDILPSFQQPDYSRSAHGSTSSSSRAPSIVSLPNGNYHGLGNGSMDTMGLQFGQLGVGSNSSRPSTSYNPSMPNTGLNGQASPYAQTSPFDRNFLNGAANGFETADDIEEIDRASMDGFALPAPQLSTSNYSRGASATRFGQTPNGLDLRNVPSFTPGAMQARSLDASAAMRPTSSSQGYPNGGMSLDRRSPPALPDTQSYMDPRIQQLLMNQVRSPYGQVYNPYAMPNSMQMPTYFPLLSPLNGVDPYAVARELPTGDGVQSALMYEFKSNTKTKRYDIKDIYDHIAEFAGDQHGSRFIQTKLETANSDEKDRVFREIEPNAIQLMTDVFGNYVIQKFFEHGDQTHKKILANKMRGQVLNLSLQMYGCRVVQKALDYVLVDQQASLINELDEYVLKCVKDQNGNHVIQKAIERCPPHNIAFVFEAFRGQVASLSIHPYGCRVIQRCLERGDSPSKVMILKELMEPQGIPSMISDQYGNYVVQHVVSKDTGHGKMRVLDIVLHGLEGFSKHKFASNVVEKCLEQADDHWRRQVVFQLDHLNQARRHDGVEDVFVGMIKDNFGNYVIQKLLDTLCLDDFGFFHDLLQPAMSQAKRTGCGKQVQSIEKKMDRFTRPPRWNGNANGFGNHNHNNNMYQHSLPISHFASNFASAANTPPPLTADTQSLQSSAIPSINGDAVEGADRSRKSSQPSSDSRYER